MPSSVLRPTETQLKQYDVIAIVESQNKFILNLRLTSKPVKLILQKDY